VYIRQLDGSLRAGTELNNVNGSLQIILPTFGENKRDHLIFASRRSIAPSAATYKPHSQYIPTTNIVFKKSFAPKCTGSGRLIGGFPRSESKLPKRDDHFCGTQTASHRDLITLGKRPSSNGLSVQRCTAQAQLIASNTSKNATSYVEVKAEESEPP
jgi:hypothetical protein